MVLLQVYPIDPKACAKMVGVVNKVYTFSDRDACTHRDQEKPVLLNSS